MVIDPQAGAAIDQMVGLAVTSPIYTATPEYPIGRPASYHQSLIYYTRILAGYAHQTNDPELWNLVGKLVQAYHPNRTYELPISTIDSYTLEVMAEVHRYESHWRQFPQINRAIPQGLAFMALEMDQALRLDPRHESFLTSTSADLAAQRQALINLL